MDDPRDELAELARSLRYWTRREESRGRRSVCSAALQEQLRHPATAAGGVVTSPRTAPAAPAAKPATPPPKPAPAPPAASAAGKLPRLEAEPESPDYKERMRELAELATTASTCMKCGLCQTRKQVVFARGTARNRIMFVGEAPGADEDAQGYPFVGRAGKLLDQILDAAGFDRELVYVANILKCRPPGNRDPRPEEVVACTPYLERQIELVQPKIICALGRHAAQFLTGKPDASMAQLRGHVHYYRERIMVVATYHPAALLRNPEWKRPTWEDVQLLRREYLR